MAFLTTMEKYPHGPAYKKEAYKVFFFNRSFEWVIVFSPRTLLKKNFKEVKEIILARKISNSIREIVFVA